MVDAIYMKCCLMVAGVNVWVLQGFCREFAEDFSGVILRVFGEGVKSARGETAIPRRADHTRNMFRTSLHTTYCK